MDVTVERIKSTGNGTIGVLFVDGQCECFTCEDEYRAVKVDGETRIPAGRYRLKLRALGESPHFDPIMTSKFGADHVGMIEICDVPGFTGVLIHIGNSNADTRGCLLVGTSAVLTTSIIHGSSIAYIALYPKLVVALRAGECWLTIIDRDR